MTPPTDATKIELIAKDIAYIQKDIASINMSIKELSGVYITKMEFDDLQKSVDARLISVEKSRKFFAWIIPIVSSVLTAVATFLVIFYLQNSV